MKILESDPVPVMPAALGNLWGSFLSRIEEGRALVRPFRRGLFSRVRLDVAPLLGDEANARVAAGGRAAAR